MKKTLNNIFLSILFLILFIVPWTFLFSGVFVFAFFIYCTYLIIYIVYKLIKDKKEKQNIKEQMKFDGNLIFDYISIAIFLNTLFVLILNILPSDISYNLQYNYLNMYKGAKTWVYILLSCVLCPLFENLLIRKSIIRFNNKKAKIALAVISSLMILIIQPSLIYGIYTFVIFLTLNLYFIEKENLKECIIFNIIINLIYSLMILYLSEYKALICTIMFMLLIINLFLKKEKETV